MKHILILVIILGAMGVSAFSQEQGDTKIVQILILSPYLRIGNEGSGALYALTADGRIFTKEIEFGDVIPISSAWKEIETKDLPKPRP
jgi:hypothetical protein